jgi:hypothetical protein
MESEVIPMFRRERVLLTVRMQHQPQPVAILGRRMSLRSPFVTRAQPRLPAAFLLVGGSAAGYPANPGERTDLQHNARPLQAKGFEAYENQCFNDQEN